MTGELRRDRRSGQRGQLIPAWGLIGGIVAVAAAAVVIVAVAVVGSQAPSPTVQVTPVPKRDADQNLTIALPYTVKYPSTVYAATLTSFPTLTCTITQAQKTRTRNFSTSGLVTGTEQTVTGALAMKITGDDRNIQGGYKLNCHLDREGKLLTAVDFPEFSIPPPEYPTPEPSASSSPVDGTYSVQYGEGVGGCGSGNPPSSLSVTTAGSMLTIKLGDNLTMTGTLNSDQSFKVSMTLSDGTMYSMTGTFAAAASHVTITGGEYTVSGGEGGCGYGFTATMS